ncbi:MAG: hypothetical protein AAF211_15570, partial [Myxococcota bacterium]
MNNVELSWSPDRGFLLKAEASKGPLALTFTEMPLPADGTVELREGVQLDPLDLMFKAVIDQQGEPGLLLGCTVQLVDADGASSLQLSAEVEDTETGDISTVALSLTVKVPSEAPESGGPRPAKMDEDELDWNDETTLDEIVVPPAVKKAAAAPKAKEPGTRGLEKLLAALASMDDDGDDLDDEDETTEAVPKSPPPPPPEPVAPSDPDDQSLGADDEARGFLELLIRGDSLELEDGAGLDTLIDGTKRILAGRGSAEAKAGRLSNWL